MLETTPDLFPETRIKSMPSGFDYRANFIGREEEAALVAEIESLPLAPYEFRGVMARRKVIAFGFQHDYQSRKLGQVAAFPSFLEDLRARVAYFAGLRPDEFEQVLVSEYMPGTPIGWHQDRAHYAKIVGVSLLSSANFRLRRRVGDNWQRASQIVEAQSAYLMEGEARSLWQHSIPAVIALRYSLTFRTMREGYAA
jgi:alkylated DNA repair dioxygenase AlkB